MKKQKMTAKVKKKRTSSCIGVLYQVFSLSASTQELVSLPSLPSCNRLQPHDIPHGDCMKSYTIYIPLALQVRLDSSAHELARATAISGLSISCLNLSCCNNSRAFRVGPG